ncbi:RHS repeat-associated core domain-containing protein [Pedobacter sp.]|uniref:RHS repeat-associated core domain-containing protein n=1 Tax=Pedobacter sp. TaxID=1411316 RepID=UPI0031D96CB1
MLKTLRFISVVSLLVLLQQYAFAAVEPYQNFLKGSIKVGDSLLVKDEKFKNTSFNWADITNISVKNAINLQVLDEQAISQSFSCTLKIRIEYFSSPAQIEATKIDDVELKVNYDKNAGAVYKGIDTYSFQNGYYVKVYVVSINSPEFGTQLPPVLQLSSMINIDRKYAFKPYLFLGINGEQGGQVKSKGLQRLSVGTVQDNQLKLSWSLIPGAEEYDIEWVSIDAGSEWEVIADALKSNNGAYSNDDIGAVFRNNATRITTHENNYTISLLYSSKYVLVRMRQVQYTADGLRNTGDWFYKQDDNNNYAIWEPSWHQENLNWQYSATYAEEGKKKEVVSYFDGSLRGRQTVTLNNSDDVAVVQENVYDEFGRAAASILPAPVRESTTNQSLHYFPSFNRNANNIPYSYADLNAANCEPLPTALNISSGASRYYSTQNQFKNLTSFNQYIPDAGGYPLSVTQYTPDNTGRIKLQGGVGYTFQPGNSEKHTTRYYYGKPEQWELDRLFGNDVGFAEHYLKNMVIDPNGQISISYLNASGKTIATALTGNTPDNVSALDNKPAAQELSMKILKPEQFNFDASRLSLNATTTYTASVPGPVTLKYDIEKLIAQYPGTTFKPCSNCYYELGITIRDNCNVVVYNMATPVKIGADASNCDDGGVYNGTIETAFNQIGEYYITFNFNLSEKVINHFTDEYVRKGQDALYLKKQSDFVLKYLAESRFQDCFADCKTARAKLGSKADFTAMFMAKLDQLGEPSAPYTDRISITYDSLLIKVGILEAGCVNTAAPCDVYRNPMLLDVSPGGQYAMVDDAGNFLETATNVLQLYFKHGAFDNLNPADTLYTKTAITKEDGTIISPYDGSFGLADLVKYWKPEWAEQFLRFHPEYCKLQFCMNHSGEKAWDNSLKEIETAAAIGYHRNNPINWLLNTDPFFTNPAHSTYKSNMEFDLTNFSVVKTGRNDVVVKNINGFIDFVLYCADTTGTTNLGVNTTLQNWSTCSPNDACRVENREWQLYRDYYLELKEKYIEILRNIETCNPATSCTIGKPISAEYDYTSNGDCSTRAFSGTTQQLSPNSFRTFDYLNNQQVTYTYITGTLSAPPAIVCSSLGTRQFYNCLDVNTPSGATTRYTNVWEITCTEPIPAGCSAEGSLTAEGSYGYGSYYTVNYPYQYQYTIYEGYDETNQPAVGCNGNLYNSIPDFYPCYTVFYNNTSYTFNNVWVNICSNYIGGGGGGGNPCDLPQTALLKAVEASTSNVEQPPCETTMQLMANNTDEQKVMADFGSNSIYRVSTTEPNESAASQAKRSNNVTQVSDTPGQFGEYEFKPYFAVQNEKGSYRIYRNVWVARYQPEPVSTASMAMRSTAMPDESAMRVSNTVTVCARISDNVNYDGIISKYIDCYGYYFHNPRKTTVELVDQNGNPVTFHMDVQVNVNFRVDHFFTSANESVTINIPNGQSSATYYYDATYYIQEINCEPFQKVYLNQNTISGASFCTSTPPSANCPAIYAEKKSRFDPDIIAPKTGLTEAQYKAEQYAALASQINTSCTGSADGWIQRLQKGLEAGNFTSKIDELRNNLITLCTLGGDLDHPFGASSLPGTGININGKEAKNFGDVIKYTLEPLGFTTFTSLLNPWLIDSPYPHEVIQQPTEVSISATTDAICTKLINLPGYGTPGFYNTLVAQYGAAMTLTEAELNTLIKGCTNCKHLLDYDIKLPVFLNSGATGCVNRNTYNSAVSDLNVAFGNTLNPASANYETIFSNYLNQRFGFFLSYQDYVNYSASNRDLLCNEPPYVAAPIDPMACVKTLIDQAYGIGSEQYNSYINEEKRKFVNAYVSTCAAAKANVTLKASQQIYHYTLYYYDLAGNLIRTVPPEGVTLLNDNEIELVQRGRKAHPEDCSYNGPVTEADQNAALQSLSNTLQGHGNSAVEMWLYTSADGGKQFIAATPDMKYMLQACVNGNLVNVDIFTLNQTASDNVSITLSNHITANVSDILPLSPWTHVVIQGTDLSQGISQIWVNGKAYSPVAGAPAAGCGWTISSNPINMPRNFTNLKHLRIYNGRLMAAGEITANAASPCFAVADGNALAWYRFNIPAAGEPTTIAENSTLETQFNGTYPLHRLTTTYAYNATNQVVKQYTPDAGISRFWYDYLSRLVISQNAKQATGDNFSYTDYDALGRIKEVGQKNTSSSGLTEPAYVNNTFYRNFLSSGSNTQITQTYYDGVISGTGALTNLGLENQRKRVSASVYRETPGTSAINATYYNYDVSGNVKTLYQQVNGLGLKTLNYEYDLISGKVNFLAYQHGQNDAFYYQYKYDADNRLTSAWSSTQANVANYGFGSTLTDPSRRMDASYQYYLHGPLARMELGRSTEKVQGLDYAYTLQGWLKGVNGTQLNPGIEMGADAGNGQNATIAKDALAYSLGYYNGDYSPIGGNGAFASTYVGANGDLTGKPLFNGNISNSTYSIAKINNGATVGYSYGYDQLNRIKNVNQHDIGTGNWNFASANNKFKESFGYDANGNILSLQRNNQNGNTMDNLGYAYNRDASGKLLNNRLAAINDAAGVTNGNDIGNNSYTYDEIGNLKTDAAEGISNIDWSIYGKIKSISKNSGGINYTYDPSGNRVSKLYNNITTYYVRDAQGNSLAVYDNAGNTSNWREQQLYGSSRLGMWKPNLNLATANGSSIWNSYGLKFFELSNHLGNVTAVVSDNRLQTGNTYEPDVINSNDYYAFGGQMPGRDFTNPGAQAYRYGFNGKENDNEVKGTGNQQDYGMRIYDPRIAKFLSVDPLQKQYPELTPYQFASNTPIQAIDLDGLEAAKYNGFDGAANLKYLFKQVDNWLNEKTDASGLIAYGYKFDMGMPVKLGSYEKASRKEAFFWGAMAYLHHLGDSKHDPYSTYYERKPGVGSPTKVVEVESNSSSSKIKVVTKVQISQSISLKNSTPQNGEAFVSYTPRISNGKVELSERAVTNGTFDFVITNNGELKIGTGHFNLSNGASSVQAAGQLKIYKGQVTTINNNSGHYKPTIVEGENSVGLLNKLGVTTTGTNVRLYNKDGVVEKTYKAQ